MINVILVLQLKNYVRMAKHRHDYKIGKSCSSKMLFSEDYDNCKIILIENYPCDNKEQLHKQERCWVEKYDCVNKNIPSRTLKEYQKEYYQENIGIFGMVCQKIS